MSQTRPPSQRQNSEHDSDQDTQDSVHCEHPCPDLPKSTTRQFVPSEAIQDFVYKGAEAQNERTYINMSSSIRQHVPKPSPFTIDETFSSHVSASSTEMLEDSRDVDVGGRGFWTDAVCINRDNAKQLARQVSNMNGIYEKSALTIVASSQDESAPTNTEDTDDRIYFARKTFTKATDLETRRQFQEEIRTLQRISKVQHPVTMGVLRSMESKSTSSMSAHSHLLKTFSSLLWLDRVWYMQEICSAKDNLTNVALSLGQMLLATPMAFYKAEVQADGRELHIDNLSTQMKDFTGNETWEWPIALLPQAITDPPPSLFVLASIGFGILITLQYHHNKSNILHGPCLVVSFVTGLLLTALAYPTHGLQINTIIPFAMILAMPLSQTLGALGKRTRCFRCEIGETTSETV